ncbi:MAG: nitroreductase family protein, partial [Acidobacteriota bacterium]
MRKRLERVSDQEAAKSINMLEPRFIPLDFQTVEPHEQTQRAKEFFEMLNRRRTVRDYSDREVPIELIKQAIAAAGTAPSGANMQPWRFVVVKDTDVKKKIREAAEKEEFDSYHG